MEILWKFMNPRKRVYKHQGELEWKEKENVNYAWFNYDQDPNCCSNPQQKALSISKGWKLPHRCHSRGTIFPPHDEQ